VRPLDFTVRRHQAVTAIVPPRQTGIERKVLRRVKAYRCAQGCIVLAVLAAAAFAMRSQTNASLWTWLHVIGVSAVGLALLAAIGSVVYRLVETPQEVTVVRGPFDWPRNPPVIHLDRKE
jgi:hypothetical protein